MNRNLALLLITQFLSAFADNAVLFTIIAIVLKNAAANWYIPALQSTFLLSFVVLGPWVGAVADRYPKRQVLFLANLLKAVGVILIYYTIEPMIAYGVIGAGAALYSPAKYGILPELCSQDKLVRANSWVEGSTIVAILTGMIVGAKAADENVNLTLLGIFGIYLISALVGWMLPKLQSIRSDKIQALSQFKTQLSQILSGSRARFTLLGSGLFWAAAATLRVIVVAWVPLVFHITQASDIANVTLFLALGIIAGSTLAPKLIPLEILRRARIPAYMMGLFTLCLAASEDLWLARTVMFFIGTAGGLFIVPINASVQEIGFHSIGSGAAVAIQNFLNNLLMLAAVGSYTLAASLEVGPVVSLYSLGTFIVCAAFLVSRSLPKLEQSTR